MKPEKANVSNFWHVKHNKRVVDADADSSTLKSSSMSKDAKDIVEEMEKIVEKDRDKFPKGPGESSKRKLDKFNAAHYSTGTVSVGLTSTVMEPQTKAVAEVLADDVVRYARVKKKGYVRLATNYGHLNLELYCDQVPKTCENFMRLCSTGYYNGTKFHRSIRHFMVS
jgi:peptidyl-prolyl cis-trans isomerase-like protein 2